MRSKITLRNKSDLDVIIGLQCPEILFNEIRRLIEYVNDHDSIDLYALIGFELDAARWYCNTPPEIFPFGWTGCDGVHYGWVNRMPELMHRDFPIAHIDPTDTCGPQSLIAETISRAFVLQMSSHYDVMLGNLEPESAAIIAEAANSLGIKLVKNVDEILYINGNGRPIPTVPVPGYWFKSGPDSIGVQAPMALFHSNRNVDFHNDIYIKDIDFHALAVKYQDRYPASALYYYKCLYLRHIPESLWAPGMKNCYAALGRKILSDNVDKILKNA